ncbi:MAG: Co2+/Mg2+ efflux protein ApaG [Rickettsiales bacterium]|nr:Co2+/Mg2+ efflux protein ApaG [Rickettsiales bacterium]
MTKLNKLTEEIIFSSSKTAWDQSYSAVTQNIHITVWPEFIDSKSSIIGDLFIWAYHVRIDNKSAESVKLLNRHWRIIDEKGIVQEVRGEGVIGEQPTILAGSSYQYSSGVHLRYPSGIMTGKYQMLKNNLEIFDVKIPTFSLDVPSIKSVIN